MKKIFLLSFLLLLAIFTFSQTFSGVVTDSETGLPLSNVKVSIIEDFKTTTTNNQGEFTLTTINTNKKTVGFDLYGYMYEEQYHLSASTGLQIKLRKKIKSLASQRWDMYKDAGNCSVSIPNSEAWNVSFTGSDLKGDLAPNQNYTRRDPSAVIKVGDLYYVWYSYSLTANALKSAPWDLNDIYYATSEDGITWSEKGAAVVRGAAGSYDARSAFTAEIYVENNKYYLVYQAAETVEGVYSYNTVAMATADSPDGPWTKLADPILRPTHTNGWTTHTDGDFDDKCVHDPCLMFYKNKYYLYYKGECVADRTAGLCGSRHIKWGVAIADNPTGPYIKSEYNPITNTGHEVSVWSYNEGIAIVQHLDGPEVGTIQYAKDGINFEIMGSASNIPEALGIYRDPNATNTPHGGIKWGLSHVLKWNYGPKGWMYLKRFITPKEATNALTNTNVNKIRVYPNKAKNSLNIKGLEAGFYKVLIFNSKGESILSTNLNASTDSSVSIHKLVPGIYFIQLQNSNYNYAVNFSTI